MSLLMISLDKPHKILRTLEGFAMLRRRSILEARSPHLQFFQGCPKLGYFRQQGNKVCDDSSVTASSSFHAAPLSAGEDSLVCRVLKSLGKQLHALIICVAKFHT